MNKEKNQGTRKDETSAWASAEGLCKRWAEVKRYAEIK